MSRNVDFTYPKNRDRANPSRPKFLAVEPLENRFMLDGDWTLISSQTELNDLGQVVSEVEDWDTTGDETADVQIVRGYSFDDSTGWSQEEQTTDYGIDGSVEEHSIHWWSETSDGFVDHQKYAFDSDGDGVLDRFQFDAYSSSNDGRVSYHSEVHNYLDFNIVYFRSVTSFDASGVGQSTIEEFDENGDGELDRRVSTSHHYEAFDGYSILRSIVIEIDEGANGSLDHRSVETYEYSDEYGSELISITTEVDQDGDGLVDSTSVVTFLPGDTTDGEIGIDGEDGSEPGDSTGGGDDSMGTDVDTDTEVEGDRTVNDPGMDIDLGSEIESGGAIATEGDFRLLGAEAFSGSDRNLAESIDWLAYQTSSAATVDDPLSIDSGSSIASLPLNTTTPKTSEPEPTDIFLQPETQSAKLNLTPIVFETVVDNWSPRITVSYSVATEVRIDTAIRRLA